MSDAANQWTKFYTTNSEVMYPAEAVIRIFKGEYPHLKMPKPKAGQSILDVGCGDGRHFPLFYDFNIAATEITSEIVSALRKRFNGTDAEPDKWWNADIRVGTCASLPWSDASFDYELAWNSCYYMEPGAKFEDHVAEMARVLKPGGWLICSIPKTSCFIFKSATLSPDGYCIIKDDHFGLRNGERMFWFKDRADIELEFGPHFTNFCHADIDIDMFGLAYNWHVFVAERR